MDSRLRGNDEGGAVNNAMPFRSIEPLWPAPIAPAVRCAGRKVRSRRDGTAAPAVTDTTRWSADGYLRRCTIDRHCAASLPASVRAGTAHLDTIDLCWLARAQLLHR